MAGYGWEDDAGGAERTSAAGGRLSRMVITVDAADDPRLADYVRLREATLRNRPHEVFIAEGTLVIRRAVEAGYRPRSFLLAPRWVDELRDLWSRYPDVPVYVGDAAMVESLTGFHVHRGALASIHRVAGPSVVDVLRGRRIVVVEDLVDHTNLGAIVRTTAALGWDGLLVSAGSADPLYRRAVKTSMGTVFSLPWARLAATCDVPALLSRAGFTTIAAALSDRARPLDEVAASVAGGRFALLLGTEGSGLSQGWLDGADTLARIPMSEGIDSLNVAAAAAIACYVLR